jgi:hypothetical protein
MHHHHGIAVIDGGGKEFVEAAAVSLPQARIIAGSAGTDQRRLHRIPDSNARVAGDTILHGDLDYLPLGVRRALRYAIMLQLHLDSFADLVGLQMSGAASQRKN